MTPAMRTECRTAVPGPQPDVDAVVRLQSSEVDQPSIRALVLDRHRQGGERAERA